ncbi:MAG: SusD/RagB family nutrient-binding outer membrane lipoprotein [Bacteroidia bacterium]
MFYLNHSIMQSLRKYIGRVAWVSAFVLLATGCNLTDTNIDPTRIAEVELRLALPNVLSQAAYNQSAMPARITGIVMQHFEGFDAQQVAYTSYVIEESDMNNYWRTGLYAGVLKDADVLIKQGIAEEQPYYVGIGKTIMAMSYGMAASFFGDIPFSQALQGVDNLKPGYDTQEQVYTGIQTMLDEAIAELQKAAVPGGPESDDLVYGGDADAWIATARALKARFYMHLTRRDAQNAGRALEQLRAGTYTSLAEQSNFTWEASLTANNPLAKFGLERPKTLIIAPTFKNHLEASADPRMSKYMVDDGSGTFLYFSSGNTDLYWAQNTSSIPLISYVEVKFIEAEALLWTGADDAAIETALREAIIASMEQMGIAAADYEAYVNANSTLANLGSVEAKLEKIMTEAWVAYFGYGFQQAWTNYLRTGYPALTPNPNGANGVNPSGVIPRRFLYPISESQTNSVNVEAARARQGGDLLDVSTWAFKP